MRLSHLIACYFVLIQWKRCNSFQPPHQSRRSRSIGRRNYNWSQSSISLQSSPPNDDSASGDVLPEETIAYEEASSRRMFFASTLVGAGVLLGDGRSAIALARTNTPSDSNAGFEWKKDPVNPKRSTFRVTDAEKRYNLSFVTYLSRFLLSFDPIAQRWWMDRSKEIKSTSSKEEILEIRKAQFARFSASVDVGLKEDDFVGNDGPRRLLHSLLQQFGSPSTETPSRDDQDRFTQETKEARRQLALLFGLLEDSQPTKEITMLLASIDNGTLETVILNEDARSTGLLGGFSPEDIPVLEFPAPEAGPEYNQATGKAVLKPTGKLLRIEVIDGGEGYTEAPDISKAVRGAIPGLGGEPAIVTAKIVNGVLKDTQLTKVGSGYTQDSIIEVKLKPHIGAGKPATIRIIPELEIAKIVMDDVGSGYAVERPLKIKVVPPLAGGEPQTIGTVYPKGKMGSFIASRPRGGNAIRQFERTFTKDEDTIISGASSGGSLPPAPFPEKASCSQQLLALLPQGFGLEYDTTERIYRLSVDKEYQELFPSTTLQAPNRPMVPDFGPRGRSPIERTQKIDSSTLLRFSISGAICASGVHLALTPLDVVKTKVQIDPDRYPRILPAFQSVWKDEGPSTFFTGWLPTVCGHFFAGGVIFATTEVIRRSLTDAAGVNAISLEVPIILSAAIIASGTAAVLYCPFDAVRIRSVSQPSYGANAIEIVSRMVKEEGVGVLTDAIPVFVARQVPYAAVKFTIFDLTTEYLYQAFPLAQEDLKLSLGVSLISGVLAGIAAATVSNPADAIISELKKATSDLSPKEAFQALLDRGGLSALFKGLPIRMVLFP